MVLMITERGVATWRCGWCAAVRPCQAYHDADLEAQQEIIEVFGAEEHYIGQDHGPLWMPDFQPTGWCRTVEAALSSTSTSAALPEVQPAEGATSWSSRMQSAPTQKQVDYLATLCGRRGKNFNDVMIHVHTKAEASLKIDELIRS